MEPQHRGYLWLRTDLFQLDTVVPIDGNGLLFAITNSPLFGHDPLFAVWFNGGNNYGFAFSGALPNVFDVWVDFGEGTGSVSTAVAVPLGHSTWPMMILGLAGLGFMAYRRRSEAALMAV